MTHEEPIGVIYIDGAPAMTVAFYDKMLRESIAKEIERLRVHNWEPVDIRLNEMVAICAYVARGKK